MKWDNIEARWLEMARRALGEAGGAGSAGSAGSFPGPALSDTALPEDGSIVVSTVSAALAAVGTADRPVA
jgi:hypothetical protein